ncbi:hypothetical protein ACP8HI_01625 [Paenibacillus sp. FA6]|uniref:hypothetical protein n=1 Tax=Paenibacillus sp. FA6 TaxID=3413029 RepID=UPI003F65B342
MEKSGVVNQQVLKLAATLVKRGFLLEVEGDCISLSAGNGPQDYKDLKHLLERAGVPVCYSGLQMQILSPIIPIEVLRLVEALPVHYARSHIPDYFYSWKAFTRRSHGVKWNSLSLDRGVAILVKTLSASGILVTGGCDGHRRQAPQVFFASIWSAAWFHVLQQQYLELTGLYYDWEVVIDKHNNPSLQAILAEHQKWNISMIQHDGLIISEMLHEIGPQLRVMKRQIFKNRSMRQQAESLENNFDELCEWMIDLITA